ncbi:N-formylglutamate deformylase [Pantoea phytobeneficialis]|uniref:N-formylglutamate deformylase n=1 Tax=Pantoea phytobeneficialis TaxID=2052056 RepID=A0AAP9KNR3_9GAMM|nr:N-formylglutamate deformylase [Pantoea phytobeneficialis]MDO6409401.1 N-formylglutamate deformylase [Pantoea phytobeneficialis]QGR06057.1 N-formylglutamate deformylase [Pantoea phytobeneficialis]
MTPFHFTEGKLPLLVSIPHAGTQLTPEVDAGLSDAARGLPDTDWHIPLLYDFVRDMGASVLIGHYSRFVIDLNRPPDNQPLYSTATTGLYPETLFDGTPTFAPGKTPTAAQRQGYLDNIWHPYHQQIQQELARIKAQHGYALLFDAHSIASVIPRLFEGRLPDLNIGTNDGASCSSAVTTAIQDVCSAQTDYSWVINGRFKGGYITRAYGQPEQGVQAVQLELAQINYMDETPPFAWQQARAAQLQKVLKPLLQAFLQQGKA